MLPIMQPEMRSSAFAHARESYAQPLTSPASGNTLRSARASALLEGARLDPALFLDVCRALAGERAAELFDIFM